MCFFDMFSYAWVAFKKPFKSRVFIISFIMFLPASTFGIYYEFIFADAGLTLSELVTPKSLLTYLIPLSATISLEGMMLLMNKSADMDKETVEFEIFRDTMLFSVLVVALFIVMLILSMKNNDIFFSIIATLILWFFWIIVCSSKENFGPTRKWSPTGNATANTANDIYDAKD